MNCFLYCIGLLSPLREVILAAIFGRAKRILSSARRRGFHKIPTYKRSFFSPKARACYSRTPLSPCGASCYFMFRVSARSARKRFSGAEGGNSIFAHVRRSVLGMTVGTLCDSQTKRTRLLLLPLLLPLLLSLLLRRRLLLLLRLVRLLLPL